MYVGDVIAVAITLNIATVVFTLLFCIAKPKCRNKLWHIGFSFGLTGALGYISLMFINTFLTNNSCNVNLSLFILSSSFFPLITLFISRIRELIGSLFLIFETLVLSVLPFGNLPSFTLTPFIGILYHLSSLLLLISGNLLFHRWRVNQILSPLHRYRELRNAGLFTGVFSIIMIIPAYFFAAFGFATNVQIDTAVLMVIEPFVALTGISLAWTLPQYGGWLLVTAGVLNIFSLFAFKTYFFWEIPLLANITIVCLLPVSSGVLLLISFREKSRILEDFIESSSKLWKLTKKEVIEKWKTYEKTRKDNQLKH